MTTLCFLANYFINWEV